MRRNGKITAPVLREQQKSIKEGRGMQTLKYGYIASRYILLFSLTFLNTSFPLQQLLRFIYCILN